MDTLPLPEHHQRERRVRLSGSHTSDLLRCSSERLLSHLYKVNVIRSLSPGCLKPTASESAWFTSDLFFNRDLLLLIIWLNTDITSRILSLYNLTSRMYTETSALSRLQPMGERRSNVYSHFWAFVKNNSTNFRQNIWKCKPIESLRESVPATKHVDHYLQGSCDHCRLYIGQRRSQSRSFLLFSSTAGPGQQKHRKICIIKNSWGRRWRIPWGVQE